MIKQKSKSKKLKTKHKSSKLSKIKPQITSTPATEKIIAEFKSPETVQPVSLPYFEESVLAAYKSRRYIECIKTIERILKVTPKEQASHYKVLLAAANTMVGKNFKRSHNLLNEVLVFNPYDAYALYGKGVAFYFEQKYDECLKFLDLAIEVDEDGMDRAREMKIRVQIERKQVKVVVKKLKVEFNENESEGTTETDERSENIYRADDKLSKILKTSKESNNNLNLNDNPMAELNDFEEEIDRINKNNRNSTEIHRMSSNLQESDDIESVIKECENGDKNDQNKLNCEKKTEYSDVNCTKIINLDKNLSIPLKKLKNISNLEEKSENMGTNLPKSVENDRNTTKIEDISINAEKLQNDAKAEEITKNSVKISENIVKTDDKSKNLDKISLKTENSVESSENIIKTDENSKDVDKVSPNLIGKSANFGPTTASSTNSSENLQSNEIIVKIKEDPDKDSNPVEYLQNNEIIANIKEDPDANSSNTVKDPQENSKIDQIEENLIKIFSSPTRNLRNKTKVSGINLSDSTKNHKNTVNCDKKAKNSTLFDKQNFNLGEAEQNDKKSCNSMESTEVPVPRIKSERKSNENSLKSHSEQKLVKTRSRASILSTPDAENISSDVNSPRTLRARRSTAQNTTEILNSSVNGFKSTRKSSNSNKNQTKKQFFPQDFKEITVNLDSSVEDDSSDLKPTSSANSFAQLNFNRGLDHYMAGELKKSLEFFQKSLNLEPDFEEADEMSTKAQEFLDLLDVVEINMTEKNYEAIVEICNEALDIDEGNDFVNRRFYFQRGMAYFHLKDIEKSMMDYEEYERLTRKFEKD